MLKQHLSQKLQQKLSPQQIQLMKLLQVPSVSIEERVKEELEENPALEEGAGDDLTEKTDEYDDVYDEVSEAEQDFDFSEYTDEENIASYKNQISNHSKDDDEKAVPFSGGRTFHEFLEEQLSLRILSDQDKIIAEQLIGNIDESGYLRREIDAIMDDLAFTQNVFVTMPQIENMLEIIQEFDPPGVGARDLKECLLIQLGRKEATDDIEHAEMLLNEMFDAFTKKHYDKIKSKFHWDDDALKGAIDEIIKLNPKPGNSMSETAVTIEHVVPDFIVSIVNNKLELTLNGRNAPDLRVNKHYSEMFKEYETNKQNMSKSQKDAVLFVKQKLDSAKWFIDAIKQRQHTLISTMQAILKIQEEYFLTGDETKLKPMILKDVAEIVDLDISTVSRVVNSKYVLTSFGTFLLKSFFSEALQTEDGDEVSSREVKKILSDLIEGEDKTKPLTDEKLAGFLKEKGYQIARRTVAKYREQLNFPVARLRKEL